MIFATWIKFSREEATPAAREAGWHKVVEIRMVTVCGVEAATKEKLAFPGAGAKVCQGCLATKNLTPS